MANGAECSPVDSSSNGSTLTPHGSCTLRAADGSFKAGWVRYDANVAGTTKIGWIAHAVRFTFTMSGDRKTIEGERAEHVGPPVTVTMKRVL